MKVGTIFEIAYAHRLLNYNGKCAHLHGHNGKVELEVEGTVDSDTGMLIDFVILKEKVVVPLMRFDHRTILQVGDPLLKRWEDRTRPIVLNEPPTAETLAQKFLQEMITSLKENSGRIVNGRVRFWETTNCYAEASS